MDRRTAARTKKRLACTLVIDGSRLSGIVLDVSSSGVFVQTSANPTHGAAIGLEMEIPGQPQRSLLAVRVARKKVVPPRLKSVAHAGLGLQIENAPEAYFSYVAQLQPDEIGGESPAVAERPAKASPAVAKRPAKAPPAVARPPAKASPAVARPPAKASPAVARPLAKASPARRSGVRRSAPPRPAAAKQERFRVRVSQIGGSRSRILEVSAASEEAARREAMAASGEGWKILDCERLA